MAKHTIKQMQAMAVSEGYTLVVVNKSGDLYPAKEVHLSEFKSGDVILIDGVAKTVTDKWIKYDSFMGVSILGGTYFSSYQRAFKVELEYYRRKLVA